MKNTVNTENTTPAGYARTSLVDALRALASDWHQTLTLSETGWSTRLKCLVGSCELAVLDYEGMLYSTPDEHPDNYTDETYDGLVEWIEDHIIEWTREAIDAEADKIDWRERYSAYLEQRPINPDASSERLESLRAILANLKRA